MKNHHFKIVSVRNPAHVPKIPTFLAVLILILSSVVTYGAAQSSRHTNLSPKEKEPKTPPTQENYCDNAACVSTEQKPLTPETKGLVTQKSLNLNMQTTFTNTTQPIICSHLSLSILLDVTPSGTVDLKPYSSKKRIAKKIPFGMEEQYNSVTKQAHDVHLIENEKLGNWLTLQFNDMRHNQTPLQKILLQSTNHAMGLWLTLTNSHEKPTYGVNLYDPNFTVIYKSVSADSLADITPLSLKSLIEIVGYKAYYQAPLETSVSMLFVLPNGPADTSQKEPLLTKHTRILTRETVFHLMSYNFHEALRETFAELKSSSLSKKTRLSLLAARR